MLRVGALALLALLLAGAAALWHLNYNDGVDIHDQAAPAGDRTALIARGAYLARTGNCLACHTARGGDAGGGGLPIATSFGTLYSSNLTPDPEHGIGHWSATAFWRALHHGRSADGRLLYPAFPYTHTTLLTREDSDALFSYFHSLPPSRQEVPSSALQHAAVAVDILCTPMATDPSRRVAPTGTAAPTWYTRSRTARPAMPAATAGAAPTGTASAAA